MALGAMWIRASSGSLWSISIPADGRGVADAWEASVAVSARRM